MHRSAKAAQGAGKKFQSSLQTPQCIHISLSMQFKHKSIHFNIADGETYHENHTASFQLFVLAAFARVITKIGS